MITNRSPKIVKFLEGKEPIAYYSVGWYTAKVVGEYPCKWGRGAMLEIDEAHKIPAGAGQLPKDFKIGEIFKVFVSFGNLIEAVRP